MTRTEPVRPDDADLTECDREPIHIPGGIQPHGLLLATEGPELLVRRASRNTSEILDRGVETVLGRPLAEALGPEQVRRLVPGVRRCAAAGPPVPVGEVQVGRGEGRRYHVLLHRSGGLLVFELEPASTDPVAALHEVSQPLQDFLSRLDTVTTPDDLLRLAAVEVRRVTGFDRVLIYRFDEDGHGTVVSEDRNDRLPSYLGLRFPASDIPPQARQLYLLNHSRIIPDAAYRPVPIAPEGLPPLDLSFSTLRSVSPIHVEYMRNMGTAASMSVSVVRDGRLWGLLSCHHAEPRSASFAVRGSCEVLSRVLSAHLATVERQAEIEHRLRLNAVQSRLIATLTVRDDFVAGLAEHADDLLAFADAAGVAVLCDGHLLRAGATPAEEDLRRLATWLAAEVRNEVFATDSLGSLIPWRLAEPGLACGLLAVSISKLHDNYLMWFRPEERRTVVWAGDPLVPKSTEDRRRMSPRASFAAWEEVVRGRSVRWRSSVVAAAAELRNAIVGVVLRAAEELAQLNAELRRSNEELEAFSYSVSHDLRAPFRHIVGYAELLRECGLDKVGASARRYVTTIIESAEYAGTLVDNLLAFSRMGRAHLHPARIDMNALVREVVAAMAPDAQGRSVVWEVDDLPPASGDVMMLRLALQNLLSNALKYTRPRAVAHIHVAGEARDRETVYRISDNGIGFDMRYAEKLFGVFQRLHRMEDFEGTGIGLANVRRIASRHGGRTWAEGTVDEGATFYLALPSPAAPVSGDAQHAQTDPPGRG
jgi:light-regulated signal transduction histidine kinase (bacteriophytochrome)